MIKDIASKVTGMVGKTKLVLKIKSPEILLGTGIALVVGGTILACRATKKAEEILAEHKEKIYEIDEEEALDLEASGNCDTTAIVKEAKSDRFVAHVKCGWDLTKLFAPAVIMEAAGVACFLGSHTIMQRRYTGAVAAYEVTNAAYRKLKEKYEQGYIEERNRSDGLVEPEKGIVESKKDDKNPPFDPDVYDFCFDESCDAWRPNAESNWSTAKMFERALNNYFQTFGYAFLNDCRTSFGKDCPGSNSSGQVIGWSKSMGDTYVDFGLGKGSTGDPNIWIRPNCHHMILGCNELNKR